MADDNDIIINIETAYRSGDMDAFKRSLDDAKARVNNLSDAQRNLESKSAGAGRELNNAQRALSGLNGAASVSRGSFQGLSQTLEVFGGKLAGVAAKFSVLAGSFSAGYAIGTTLDKWLGISQKIADLYAGPMSKVGSIQSRISADLKQLDSITLDRLKAQFEGITSTLAESNAALGEYISRTSEIAGAAHENVLSRIERDMPPGPERDKAIANEQRRFGLREVALRRTDQEERIRNAQAAIDAADIAYEDAIISASGTGPVAGETDPVKIAEGRIRQDAAINAVAAAKANAQAIRAKQASIISAAQERLQVLRPGGIAEQTVANKFFAASPSSSDSLRSSVTDRLQSLLNTEEGFASRGDTPVNFQLQGAQNASALRELMRQVQSGNDEITKELIKTFADQANNNQRLQKALEVLKSSLSNAPL
jgi:hypothetical protein